MKQEKDIAVLVGGVYKTGLDKNPIRIISYDSYQVFYETWTEYCKDWSNRSELNGKSYYYRTSLSEILVNAEFLTTEPLSELEERTHRPDLPHNVCRHYKLKWTGQLFSSLHDYEDYLLSESVDISSFKELNVNELYLVPFGVKGAYKKGVLIKAINGINFSGIELLWHAHNIQAPYIKGEVKAGIGIHRLGFEKGIPSFYIGGYYDSAGLLKN